MLFPTSFRCSAMAMTWRSLPLRSRALPRPSPTTIAVALTKLCRTWTSEQQTPLTFARYASPVQGKLCLRFYIMVQNTVKGTRPLFLRAAGSNMRS
ncbi:hypothetical protein CHELA40_11403 [Chelatococcus asaccharovorans]|nr:hypothetical protein CHELA40_11403 [Chelatococcus asaccharovorans]CAH1684835.1 hypothetical protein CHELA17_64198 [Chelatococcus asaccharovorans]